MKFPELIYAKKGVNSMELLEAKMNWTGRFCRWNAPFFRLLPAKSSPFRCYTDARIADFA
jgi:hypothetical protein